MNSLTEKQILGVLSDHEPQTVKMISSLLPGCSTVGQALTHMWKRGVVVRRRQQGSNTYWYARTLDAFERALPSAVFFTNDERMRRTKWDEMVAGGDQRQVGTRAENGGRESDVNPPPATWNAGEEDGGIPSQDQDRRPHSIDAKKEREAS
jgi:hypothetical protein